MSDASLEPALLQPSGFRFGEVSSFTALRDSVSSVPSLGPLAAFTGAFRGSGFNTIFRPDLGSPTRLPIPVTDSDNLLELNLTQETLSFSPSLGSVPNRGEVMPDIFLNGVPYLQVINDVTVPSQPVGIHFEPGLWMAVPATTDPNEGPTVVRMASIPHGTTIEAQGTSSTIHGKPVIAATDITPFTIGHPNSKVPFPSQTAANKGTAAHPAGPDVVHQGRHHHPGHADRPQHLAAQPHRVADHHVHHRHRHHDRPGCPAVRRRDGQHRLPARQPVSAARRMPRP